MTTREVILTLALMLGAGLVAGVIADALRLPRMILLLVAGTILGPAATGWIDVPLDSIAAQLILTLGVSIILFHGGLDLSLDILRRVAVGLGLLVVPGVIVTAVIVGLIAAAVFGVPVEVGLLIGAVLAPTDPAILIPLFERLGVRPKVSQTVIAESAFNDPVGAVLALTFAGIALHGSEGFADPILDFLEEIAISTAIGIAIGVVLALVVSRRRGGIWRESAAIAVVAIVAALYYIEDSAGGSGYLGVFLAGLIVGNMDKLRLGMHGAQERSMRIVIEQMAAVMVILIFVTLGASLPWSDLADEWAPALAVVATLILVARPLVVALCLAPDRRGGWTRDEAIFVAWTRETGVVPAALAGLVVAMDVPHAELVVVCVAVAVIVTLLVQTTTKPALARRLGLVEYGLREVRPPGTGGTGPAPTPPRTPT
jgi:cell volume regulation protein A